MKLLGLETSKETSAISGNSMSLDEKPLWYWVSNVFAIALIAVAFFFWIFYA